MDKIVVVAGKRTPFGDFGGTLKDISAIELGVIATKATLDQVQFPAKDIDHVIFGNVIQSGPDAIYTPRHIGLKVGTDETVPALGLNRLCGSGFQAWVSAAQMILTGEAKFILAGGTEQMSQIPFVLRGARWGYRMGTGVLEDFMTTSLTDNYTGLPMGITAENLAEQYNISRTEVDELALRTQKRYGSALAKKYFTDEIVPVEYKLPKTIIKLDKDEHPKPETTMEILSKLKAVFKKDGTVTAGNASGIVDGAACSLIMSENDAKKRGLKPLCEIISWASVGCDPKIMGIGPVGAIKKALQKANLTLDKMDLVEVNEAFGSQYLAVEKELKLDPERTNVNGSSIALGHPLAATGARIMNHLMYELQRRNGKYAVGSACIGGGQGIAVVIKK